MPAVLVTKPLSVKTKNGRWTLEPGLHQVPTEVAVLVASARAAASSERPSSVTATAREAHR